MGIAVSDVAIDRHGDPFLPEVVPEEGQEFGETIDGNGHVVGKVDGPMNAVVAVEGGKERMAGSPEGLLVVRVGRDLGRHRSRKLLQEGQRPEDELLLGLGVELDQK